MSAEDQKQALSPGARYATGDGVPKDARSRQPVEVIRQIVAASPSAAWALAGVAWAGSLAAAAIVLEHGFGLAPCALCLTQRLFVLLAGLMALLGLAHNPRLGVYPLATALAALVGAGFAIRHLYLLSPYAGEVASCGVDVDYMIAAYPLMDILEKMTMGSGECADQSAAIPVLALLGLLGLLALAVAHWRSR